jgi:hypothetical protein
MRPALGPLPCIGCHRIVVWVRLEGSLRLLDRRGPHVCR